MSTLPEPPIAADTDLRDFDWMPLRVNQLMNSDLVLEGDFADLGAAVTMWMAAWHQVPAGSLPDDDRKLARLAGYGRDIKGWRKMRARALRGFYYAGDGRLYHSVLAELVKEAVRKRDSYRRRKQQAQQAAQKRWHEKPDVPPDDATANADAYASADATALPSHDAYRDRDRDRDSPPSPPSKRIEPSEPEQQRLVPEPGSDDDPQFQRFWQAWPRKTAKGQARKAWRAAVKNADAETIIQAAQAFAERCRAEGTETKYIPHPATWLNGERWADEPADGEVGGDDGSANGDGEPWQLRVNAWQNKGLWLPEQWGPAPGEPGCQVPADLLVNYQVDQSEVGNA